MDRRIVRPSTKSCATLTTILTLTLTFNLLHLKLAHQLLISGEHLLRFWYFCDLFSAYKLVLYRRTDGRARLMLQAIKTAAQ